MARGRQARDSVTRRDRDREDWQNQEGGLPKPGEARGGMPIAFKVLMSTLPPRLVLMLPSMPNDIAFLVIVRAKVQLPARGSAGNRRTHILPATVVSSISISGWHKCTDRKLCIKSPGSFRSRALSSQDWERERQQICIAA